MSAPLRLDAPAKLNLSLRVVGRRDDGFHLLDTTMVLLDLADRLLLLPGCSGLRLEGSDARDLPLDASNLAWRGLVAGLGTDPDLLCVALEKRIPAGAGLGGGSADAAAGWRLGRAWRGVSDRPGPAELEALSHIGADVPFLASGLPAARASGIGERLEPLEALQRRAVLLHPPFALATGAVFAELRPEEWGIADNDLLGPATRLRPELVALMDAMRRAGGSPQLSGSGSTIFTLTDDPDRAAAVGAGLQEAGLRVTMTNTRTAGNEIERIDEEEDDDR